MKNQTGFTLIELMIVVAIIGVLSAIAIPQYQNHVAKAQTGRIIAELAELRLSVEDCLNEGKDIIGLGANQCDPRAVSSNLIQGSSQVGVVLPNNTGVAQLDNPLSLEMKIVATVSEQVLPALKAKKIVWTRSEKGDWECTSNIEEKFLPSHCDYNAVIQ